MSKPMPAEKRTPKCAQCSKKPIDADYRPFCSKRCADLDLGQWLKGGYVIAGKATDEAVNIPESDFDEINSEED